MVVLIFEEFFAKFDYLFYGKDGGMKKWYEMWGSNTLKWREEIKDQQTLQQLFISLIKINTELH
jgi:hypothetical protein